MTTTLAVPTEADVRRDLATQFKHLEDHFRWTTQIKPRLQAKLDEAVRLACQTPMYCHHLPLVAVIPEVWDGCGRLVAFIRGSDPHVTGLMGIDDRNLRSIRPDRGDPYYLVGVDLGQDTEGATRLGAEESLTARQRLILTAGEMAMAVACRHTDLKFRGLKTYGSTTDGKLVTLALNRGQPIVGASHQDRCDPNWGWPSCAAMVPAAKPAP